MIQREFQPEIIPQIRFFNSRFLIVCFVIFVKSVLSSSYLKAICISKIFFFFSVQITRSSLAITLSSDNKWFGAEVRVDIEKGYVIYCLGIILRI